jgi:hypothetical protein
MIKRACHCPACRARDEREFWAIVGERPALLEPVPTAWHIRELFEPHTHELRGEN